MSLHLLDLFSGVGGFSLGLERSGFFKTQAFVEIDPFCRRVLAKHWPEVPQYDDIRTLTADRLRGDGITVDAICGGFPCQDISFAGKGAGIEGERSGLWSEYARLIGELRPRYVIVENVAALLVRGLDRVLGDLAALGFDAEWHCIPASAVGAPHRRDRLWIIAHAQSLRRGEGRARGSDPGVTRQLEQALRAVQMGHADQGSRIPEQAGIPDQGFALASARDFWRGTDEPPFRGVAHGIPNGLHRVAALGNAVVPQIPELIGRAIAAAEAA